MATAIDRMWSSAALRYEYLKWTDSIRWNVSGVADAATALSTILAEYPIDSLHPELGANATVKNMAVVQAKSPNEFVVQVNYETPSRTPWNPTGIVYLSFQITTRQEPTDRDANNNTIVNSAGDPFDPAVQKEVSTVIITILKWQTSYSANTALTFVNCANSVAMTVTGVGAVGVNCMRCLNYGPIDKIATVATRFQCAYQFEYDPNGFYHRILDKGYRGWYIRTGETTKRIGHIMDMNRQPVASPVLLNNGMPVMAEAYVADDGKFGAWVSNPQLPTSPTALTVEAPASGVGMILKYPKYNLVDYAGFNL